MQLGTLVLQFVVESDDYSVVLDVAAGRELRRVEYILDSHSFYILVSRVVVRLSVDCV